MKEFNSPSPQPEDPGRALGLRLEEDPDMSVELVNGTFYQASYDGASVAITADYPGLLPISRVSQAKNPILRRGIPFRCHALLLKYRVFEEMTVGARGRAPRDPSATGVRIGQAHEEGSQDRHASIEVRKPSVMYFIVI